MNCRPEDSCILTETATESRCFCKECLQFHSSVSSTVSTDVIRELQQSGSPPSVEEDRLNRSDFDFNTRHSPDGASFHSSLNPNCTSIKDGKRKPIIYLTFSCKSKRHTREIKKLCQELRDSLGFSVKCDNYDALRKAGELNIYQWRDNNYSRAEWILFCVSPEYSDTIRAGERCPHAEICENEKGMLYINNIGRAEFKKNGNEKCRMIPLLFTKTKASECHLPCFLASSPYYRFPKEKDELFDQLRKQK